MEEKWDKDRIKKEIEESHNELFNLSKQLMEIVLKFCMRAVKTFEEGIGEELVHSQLIEIANKEIEAVIHQISNPSFINSTIREVESIYRKEKS